jgi:hypothetical protein
MCQEDEIKYEEYKDDYTLMKAAEDEEDDDKEESEDY